MKTITISGFADEISQNFDEQLATVKKLGMSHICLRTADGKNIAEYSVKDVQDLLLPRLNQAGIKVSSLGSPIGKISIEDDAAFTQQLTVLDTLCRICKLLDCRYIRMFSFYLPKGQEPAQYKNAVIAKLKQFAAIAEKHDIILIHENEKEIYGDTGQRCQEILTAVNSTHFKAAFDFANFVQCGEDTIECWALLQKHIVYIHIKDAVSTSSENVLCGTGEGHIPELLHRAIKEEGYQGFLTLEPHLVLFDALAQLETTDAKEVIKVNKYATGAEGYAAQYHALCNILEKGALT